MERRRLSSLVRVFPAFGLLIGILVVLPGLSAFAAESAPPFNPRITTSYSATTTNAEPSIKFRLQERQGDAALSRMVFVIKGGTFLAPSALRVGSAYPMMHVMGECGSEDPEEEIGTGPGADLAVHLDYRGGGPMVKGPAGEGPAEASTQAGRPEPQPAAAVTPSGDFKVIPAGEVHKWTVKIANQSPEVTKYLGYDAKGKAVYKVTSTFNGPGKGAKFEIEDTGSGLPFLKGKNAENGAVNWELVPGWFQLPATPGAVDVEIQLFCDPGAGCGSTPVIQKHQIPVTAPGS